MQALFPLVTATLACWYISSSLWVYPHSLSYFNESIGGPLNGPEHLLGSSVDWGQDELYVLATSPELDLVRILDTSSSLKYKTKELNVCVLGLLSNRSSDVEFDRREQLLMLFKDGIPLTYTKRVVNFPEK